MRVIYQRKPSTSLTPKEGTKNNYKQSLHSTFRTNFQSSEMFKNYRHVFGSYMYIWKFYFKLMNNKLPNCFSSYKPVLPVVNERYEILNPGFHLPVINYKFAEQSLKYCLIRQLNKDQSSNIIADKALWVSFYSFKVLVYLKNRIVGTYKELCEIANCHVCNIVKNA